MTAFTWCLAWLLMGATWLAGIGGGVWLGLHGHPWLGFAIAFMALQVSFSQSEGQS